MCSWSSTDSSRLASRLLKSASSAILLLYCIILSLVSVTICWTWLQSKQRRWLKTSVYNSHTRSWKRTLLSQWSFFVKKQTKCMCFCKKCVYPSISSRFPIPKNFWWWSWISCIPLFVAHFLMLHPCFVLVWSYWVVLLLEKAQHISSAAVFQPFGKASPLPALPLSLAPVIFATSSFITTWTALGK